MTREQSSAQPTAEEETTSVRADNSEPAPRFYANFCVVRHTPVDFNIEFCEIAALHEDELQELAQASEKIIRVPVRVEVVWPAAMMPTLIEMFQTNYEKFGENFGESKETAQDAEA